MIEIGACKVKGKLSSMPSNDNNVTSVLMRDTSAQMSLSFLKWGLVSVSFKPLTLICLATGLTYIILSLTFCLLMATFALCL